MVLNRDFKIVFVIVCIVMFVSTTSLFPLSKNTNANYVFAQGSNSSVKVENRAINPENLLCDNGIHSDTEGICADGSHPLVIRANPLPTTEEFVNGTNSATTNIVSLCADRTFFF